MSTVVQLTAMTTEEPPRQTYGFTVREGLLSPVEAKPLKAATSPTRPAAAANPDQQQSPHTPQKQALSRSHLTPSRSNSMGQHPGSRGREPNLRGLAALQHPPQPRRHLPAGSRRNGRRSRSHSREASGNRPVPRAAAAAAETEPHESSFGIRGLMSIASGSFTPQDALALSAQQQQPHLEVVGTTHASSDVRRLVRAVTRGLKCCQEPDAAETGLGGTYFFRSEAGAHVAIVKPCDEEPLAPNNPKGFVGRELGQPGLKPTVRVGEAALREVAAFLLDHDNFARVPPTVLVRVSHPIFHRAVDSTPAPLRHSGSGTAIRSSSGNLDAALQQEGKLGSLQEFIIHDGDTSEVGASRFSVADVHRIGILDVRLFNTDRHAGNMLIVRPRDRGSRGSASGGRARLGDDRSELRPIDHGFCLPEALEPPYFEWLHWPQAMMPFSKEELAYIAKLDPAADCELLRRELPALRPECGRTLQVATALLQAAAAAGLSLAEIGEVMSRPLVGMEEEASQLERLCLACRAAVLDDERDDTSSYGSSSASSERSWDADGSESEASGDDLSDDAELGYDWGNGGLQGSLGRLRSCSARGAGSSSLADISEHGSGTDRASQDGHCPAATQQQHGTAQPYGFAPSADQVDSQLRLLGLADAPRHLGQTLGGSLQRLDQWQHHAGGLQKQQSASVTDLASTASGTLSTANSFPRLASSAACRLPSTGDDLLFALDDGGRLHTAGSRTVNPAPASTAEAARDMTRRHSSPVGSVELPQALVPQLSGNTSDRRRHSSGAVSSLVNPTAPVRMSPRTPAALYAERGAIGWADSSSPETPSPDAAAAAVHQFDGALSPFMLHARRLPGLPSRPRSAMGGLNGGSSFPNHNAASAATEGPMAMSLALPSTVQRPRRPLDQRRHHRHDHHKAKRQAPAVYPPPIEGRAPTAVNAVFTGLDARQWATFMELLREGISAALSAGDWRSERQATGGRATAPAGGTSCPRF